MYTDYCFTAKEYKSLKEWEEKAAYLREQIHVCAGLIPELPKLSIQPVVTGRQQKDGITVENLYFESLPGVFVAGNLYYPSYVTGKIPGILNPHGHWDGDRFEQSRMVDVPARCADFARNGMAAFSYDMVGRGESLMLPHGFRSREREAYGISLLGLQLYHSIRCLDFLLKLPFIDGERIGCTGASGGGTQTFLLAAVDERIKAAAPVNMISFRMQGGCECENVPGLRRDTNNVELAALMAPRPMMITGCTGDWTYRVPEEEFPALQKIYELYGAREAVNCFYCDAPHNYREDVREAVCRWFFELFYKDARGNYQPESSFPFSIESLKTYSGGRLPEGTRKIEAFTEQMKLARKEACRRMLKTKQGKEKLYRAMEVLFGLAREKEQKVKLICEKGGGPDVELYVVGGQHTVRRGVSSGIEAPESPDWELRAVYCLECDAPKPEPPDVEKNQDVFQDSATAMVVQRIITSARLLKKQGYRKVYLNWEEDFLRECVIAILLCDEIERLAVEQKEEVFKDSDSFFQPGFEGLGGMESVWELLRS